MKPHSPSLRLTFLRPEGPSSAAEQQRLERAGLALKQIRDEGEIHLAEWRSEAPGLTATLVLGQDLAAADNACAYFGGRDRVELAARLAPVLSYVPIELMHLAARGSPVREERITALVALGQFYMAEPGGSYWDTDVEETVSAARSDPDVDVRLHALVVEAKGVPAAAGAHVDEELSRAREPRVRERLEVLRRVAEKQAGEVGPPSPLRPGAPMLGEGRLALPIHVVERGDAVVRRFSDAAHLVGRSTAVIDGEDATELLEIEANELDARMVYVADPASSIGCTYFSGPDRVVMATGSAYYALKYFPIDLAKNVVAFGQHPPLRVLGLRALAWSASHRMLPGRAMDPEIRAIIAAALADPDPSVRAGAESATVLLREELGGADDPGR